MKKRYHLITTLPTFVVLGCIFFFLLLPHLADLYLLPRFIKTLPFTEKELSLSKLTPWMLRGTVTLSDEERQTLSIPRFELHYTPVGLLKGEVSRLLIDSASLYVELQNGKPIIPGVASNSTTTQTAKKNPPSLLLPLTIDTIIVKNSTLTLLKNQEETSNFIADGQFFLQFSKQIGKGKLLSAVTADILLRGDITIDGRVDAKSLGNGHEVRLKLHAPHIGQLSPFFHQSQKSQLSGELSLDGLINIEKLSRITGYEATATLSSFRYSKNNLVIENNSVKNPVIMTLAGDTEKARYSLANVTLIEPERSTFDLDGDLDYQKSGFTGTGRIFLNRTKSSIAMNFHGNKTGTRTLINYGLETNAFALRNSLSVSPFKIDGTVIFDGSIFSGYLDGQIPKILDSNSKTSLVNLSLKMNFQFPRLPQHTVPPGELTIDEIHYQGVNSGNLQASITPSSKGIDFSTLFTSTFNPDLQLVCDGSASITKDVSFNCHIPEVQIDSSSLPPYLMPPEELSYNGLFTAEGQFSIKGNRPNGRLTARWENASLMFHENTFTNINLFVDFPNLPLLQSAPSQLCTIDTINLGRIKLSDARIRFRIENDHTVFIEKSRLNWCGGKVEAGSFKVTKTMDELDTTLYCDRLGFTELLGQFGIDNAEGQGSLNGRLPILIDRNGIKFDDGFLFSTPGNSGIVRFNNTEQLRQGIPDISQTAYLDYSMKALENFSYNWTKLSFNSQEEDLLITMQLDGKPTEPLPFGYKDGHIVPSTKGSGLQHPIRLDVNFRLPLQDMFQYGKNIKSIMEKM